MSKTKPADVRLYVDADILGLAKLLVQVRPDVTYPGDPGGVFHKHERPPCPIDSPAVKDPVWLPIVARNNWLIVTRDRHIQDHRAEIAAVRDNNAKMIALSADEAKDSWSQLEIFMCQWRHIEQCLNDPGPFIYTATRTKLRRVDLN